MPRLAGGPGDRDAAARGVGVGPAGAGAHLLLFRPADAPEAAGEDAGAAYLNKGSLASTRVYASTLRDRADAHRRAFRTVAVSLPSPPASWRWHVGLTHKSCARFAGRWLDAELEARLGAAGAEAEGDALAEGARERRGDGSRAPARRRARRRADRRGGARGARARARRRGGGARHRRAAGAAGPGVRSERRSERRDGRRRALGGGGARRRRRGVPSATTSVARAPPPRSEPCRAPSESLAGETGNAETSRTRTSPGALPAADPAAAADGARHVRAEPGRLRREGRARRGCVAHRDARGASRVSAARLPRAAGRPLRRVRAGPRARRRRRRRVRARRDAARSNADFETLEGLRRNVAFPSRATIGRARIEALTRRLEREGRGTRTRRRTRRRRRRRRLQKEADARRRQALAEATFAQSLALRARAATRSGDKCIIRRRKNAGVRRRGDLRVRRACFASADTDVAPRRALDEFIAVPRAGGGCRRREVTKKLEVRVRRRSASRRRTMGRTTPRRSGALGARRDPHRQVVPGGRGGCGGRPERGPRGALERERGAAAARSGASRRRAHSHNLCCGVQPLAPRARAALRALEAAASATTAEGEGAPGGCARGAAAWGLALAAGAAVARAGSAF